VLRAFVLETTAEAGSLGYGWERRVLFWVITPTVRPEPVEGCFVLPAFVLKTTAEAGSLGYGWERMGVSTYSTRWVASSSCPA
jgi:hypothetical protein